MKRKYPLSCAQDGIRPLLAAGQFFPDEPEELATLLRTIRSAGMPFSAPAAEALMVPHGHHSFAGIPLFSAMNQADLTDAAGFLLLGTVHREREERVWLPDYSGFATPFGVLPVPQLDEALPSSLFTAARMPFEEEPCFDGILTALGFLGAEKPVLPLLAGSESQAVAAALDAFIRRERFKGYLPIATANYRNSGDSTGPDPVCGGMLAGILEALFPRHERRWYYGTEEQYCSAVWKAEHRG